ARRASAAKGIVQQAQYRPDDGAPEGELRSIQLKPPAGGSRRVRFFPRGGGRFNVDTHRSENTTPPEQVVVLLGGINVLVEGIDQPAGAPEIGAIDLSADRVVFWTDAQSAENFSAELVQPQDLPLQIYLEGNIVVRQGQIVLRASQAFYDMREER